MAIFFNFSSTLNDLHPLQIENCDSNLQLVGDEDDNGKFRVERVEALKHFCISHVNHMVFTPRTVGLKGVLSSPSCAVSAAARTLLATTPTWCNRLNS